MLAAIFATIPKAICSTYQTAKSQQTSFITLAATFALGDNPLAVDHALPKSTCYVSAAFCPACWCWSSKLILTLAIVKG